MVNIKSPLAITMLRKATAELKPSDLLLRRPVHQARANFQKLINLFELDLSKFNWYCLRRGGATAYFVSTGSMDRTIAIGRWECTSTAKIYIQEAAAQSAEMRLSNILLWQISYAELWVTERCWPDFRLEDLLTAIRDFATRERRFGGLSSDRTH